MSKNKMAAKMLSVAAGVILLAGCGSLRAEPTVMNNFVTELLKVRAGPSQHQVHEFQNPRDGWVFFSTTADEMRAATIRVCLDSAPQEKAVITHEKGKTAEAMRRLAAGDHRIDVWTEGKPSATLIVRTMPEIIFPYFYGRSSSPDGAPYQLSDRATHGADRLRLYHWDFLQENILKSVNVICGYSLKEGPTCPPLKKWRAEGRKLIAESRFFSQDTEKLYAGWSNVFKEPFDGIIIDEFIPPKHGFKKEIMAAVKKIHGSPELKGTFYAYMGLPWNVKAEESRLLMETIMPLGYKWVHECYLWEQDTEAEAKSDLDGSLRQKMLDFRKAFPGSEKSCLVCLSILEAWDCMPHVDFKVWLDMQMNMMANDPAFEGLGGVCAYNSNVTDPELIRWLGRLYRHYCIEGKTEMASPRYGFSLMLNHIENLDSTTGETGWNLSPAEKGSIRGEDAKKMNELFAKQGYRPKKGGYILMKRSAKKPNTINQQIKDLKPGRLYSFRMFTCDTDNVETRQKYAVSVNLKGVEVIEQKSLHEIEQGDSLRRNVPCWNYHYRVFRAEGSTAKLIISDWANEKEPGGPIGQELMYNFVQVQPYYTE